MGPRYLLYRTFRIAGSLQPSFDLAFDVPHKLIAGETPHLAYIAPRKSRDPTLGMTESRKPIQQAVRVASRLAIWQRDTCINCYAFYEFTKCAAQFINCANSQIAPNSSTELRRYKNCVFFLPANILTGVARRLLGRVSLFSPYFFFSPYFITLQNFDKKW